MLLEDPELKSALKVALNYLKLRDRLEGEVRKKLASKEFDQGTCHQIIEYLKDKKFLDDERYISSYIESKTSIRSYGPYRIKNDLLQKGASSQLIDKYLCEIDTEDLLENALKLLNKKYSPDEKYEKMARFLALKGYSAEVVGSAISHFRKSNES